MVVVIAILFIGIYSPISILFSTNQKPSVEIELQCNQTEIIEAFYDVGFNYNLNDHSSKAIQPGTGFQVVNLPLNNDTLLRSLRIDLGALPSTYQIKRISLVNHYGRRDFKPAEILVHFKPESDIDQFELGNNAVVVRTTGEDPIFTSQFDIDKEFKALGKVAPERKLSLLISFALCIGVLLIAGNRLYSYRWKPSRSLLFIGFIICISTPLYMVILGLHQSNDNSEFRTKAAAPKWNLNEWEMYIKKYTLFFEDQFGMRPELIQFYSNYKLKIWHSSPVPDKVFIGRDNWLFTVEDSLMEDFRGMRKFNVAQLEEIKNNILYRKNRLKSMGIDYYIVIAPNKQTIYPEKIPYTYSIVDVKTRWMQTRDYLNDHGINFIIDPTDSLLKIKHDEMPYFKTDLHWNNYGAFIASQILLDRVSKNHPHVSTHIMNEYKVTRETFTKGDLARMINAIYKDDVEYKFESPQLNGITYLPGPTFPSYVSTQPIILTLNNDTTKPNVLVFKDSFGNGMTQFISEESNRAVYVWTHVFDWAIIEQEKPDIVIHEISEKLIHKFLEE